MKFRFVIYVDPSVVSENNSITLPNSGFPLNVEVMMLSVMDIDVISTECLADPKLNRVL
jgi:hypothetical protein